jgi:hypothetical protein
MTVHTFSKVVIFLPLSSAADMASSDCRGLRFGGARFGGIVATDGAGLGIAVEGPGVSAEAGVKGSAGAEVTVRTS